MIIETQRLRLRPFEMEDAVWFFEVAKGDEVKRYLVGAYCRSLEEAKNNIKFYYSKADFIHGFYFVIEQKKSHKRVGFLDITQDFEGKLDVAMLTDRKYRGKGYIVEAVNGFVKGFSERVSKKILEFCIDRENEASLKAVKKMEGIAEKTDSYPKDLTKEFQYFVLET